MKKLSGLLVLFFVAIVALTSTAQADAEHYFIKKVLVDNIDITGSSLDVKRGDMINIEIWVQGKLGNNTNSTSNLVPDVRAEARIIGYEFGEIAARSGLFSIEGDNLYKKTLSLSIPKDIDASEKYTLRVEVADSRDEDRREFDVHLDEQRHSLNIFDIALNPSSRIQAGQPLFPSVVVENLGAMKEENIKVTVSVPKLGISAVNFIDELVPELVEERQRFDRNEESSQRVDFLLRMPEDAKSGEYDLQVEVLYNRGHSVLSATRKFSVQGVEAKKEVDTVINIDSTSKSVKQGEEAVYKVMFANLGNERGIYSVQVDGVSWAQSRTEPGFVTVGPDSTAEAMIYMKPNDNTEPRNYVSVVRVLLGREIINEFTLNTNVLEGEEAEEESATSALKVVLAVIFSVLVIALIVLGLIIAFRKIKSNEEEEQVSNVPAEGQTYYYHPRR